MCTLLPDSRCMLHCPVRHHQQIQVQRENYAENVNTVKRETLSQAQGPVREVISVTLP
jgi:hypothetical protein